MAESKREANAQQGRPTPRSFHAVPSGDRLESLRRIGLRLDRTPKPVAPPAPTYRPQVHRPIAPPADLCHSCGTRVSVTGGCRC